MDDKEYPFNREKMNREVWCPSCKDYSFTDLPAPKCPLCGRNLITVVYNVLTKQRITGVENGTRETEIKDKASKGD